MTRKLRTTTATAAVAAALASAPAAAQADTMAIGHSPDPTEEVGFVVGVAGQSSAKARVYATIKPLGAAGCGPTHRTDADGRNVMLGEQALGHYSVAGTAEVPEPGAYLVCAWLQDAWSATHARAAASHVVEVRPARASLRVRGPRRIARGRTARFAFTGTSELGRYVFATVKRTRSRRCGSARRTDPGDAVLFRGRIQGRFRERGAPHRWNIRRPGRYVICAWVQEGYGDLEPEARARFTFRVRRR